MANYFGKCDGDLMEVLDVLPEPILVVGNKNPDGDSVGCVAALINYLREEGREVYTYFCAPVDETLSWMVDEEDLSPTILEDYKSLIVVDDFVDADRLGIIVKDNVPIVNIDHHMSRKPNTAPVDGSIYRRLVGDWTIEYWACLPATACLLIDEHVYHEYLWISLFTDSVGFTVNGVTATRYVHKLAEGLRNLGMEFSDANQERMYQLFNRVGSFSSFNTLMEAQVYQFSGTHNDKPIQILLGVIDSDDIEAGYKTMGTLRAYSHVSAVVNKCNGRVSLRARSYDFNVSEVAQKFGGGGHIRASGCSVRTGEGFLSDLDRLIEALIDPLDNVRSKVYV